MRGSLGVVIGCTRCDGRSLSNDDWDIYSVQEETMISPIIDKSACPAGTTSFTADTESIPGVDSHNIIDFPSKLSVNG